MKKTLSKILVSLCMLGVFLLPFSNTETVKTAEAQSVTYFFTWYNQPGPNEPGTWVPEEFSGPNAETDCETARLAKEAEVGLLKVQVRCSTSQDEGEVTRLENVKNDRDDIEFGCDWYLPFTPSCLLSALYHVIFAPLAGITAVTANILDFFVYYSTSSSAYSNDFVGKAWGTVRDIANIFFIIGLLFIAIKTILGLNTTNNRKLLANLIIFALLVNFSLFATKVIIDASNILAKVFYHQITPVDSNGVQIKKDSDQRSVTVGLVRTFDPINMFERNADGKVDVREQKGQFFFVTFLAIILMCFMIYVFITVSFLFAARVASLWLSMIFSPLAFASNAISDRLPGFGWGEWLSGLLKNAFLAPVFIFFLYIIILFGDVFSLATASVGGTEDVWLVPVMSTLIPFLLVFVLLSKAKDLAKSMAGDMGKAISTGAVAIGGLALGGAALGTAFAGRQIAGRSMAAMSRRKGAGDYAEKKMEFSNEVKNGTFSGGWNDYKKAKGLKYNALDRLGGRVNYSQKKTQDVDHAREELDEAQKKAHLEGVDKSHLTDTNKKKIKETFIDSKKTEIEDKLRKGDEKTLKLVSDTSLSKAIAGGQEAYKARNRGYLVNDAMSDNSNLKRDKKGNLTNELKDDVKKKIEDTLTINFNAMLKDATKQAGDKKYTDTVTKAEKGVGIGTRGMAKTTSGSYDIRDAAKMVTDKRASLGVKGTAMLIAAVAGAIRLGVKKGAGMEPGKSNADFAKDIASLIKDSLNVKIDLGGGGGDGGGHAKPSGGGGHGGGGGHH